MPHRAPASADVVRRALAYPYEIPRRSYVFDPMTGHTHPLVDAGAEVAADRDRTPVLAIASNAAPEQLARKLGARTATSDPVVAVRVTVRDHDVVYAARVSAYGAIPATLVESADTEVDLHVLLLTPQQREALDRSESLESAYALHTIPRDLVDGGPGLREDLVTYVAAAGPLRIDGEPIGLAATPARSARRPRWDQARVLQVVAERCGLEVTDWITRVTTDDRALDAMRAQLRAWSEVSDPTDENPSLRPPG
ncbi:MAG TPA: hypothetical protein VFW06_10280 [Acidimicrobiia bacterium]|nr:hypothetical protein [Acidimicrobiia bacterium]